ncbi:MAG: tetratricopeptide repeat protein [Anaerolineae bacterium]|nr:tetratricopeptide repeat protein [Anaerolineae bacterium]
MAHKRLHKKPPVRHRRASGTPEAPPDYHSPEKMMSDLNRLLSQQEFANIDEVNAFMEKLMASGQPPSAPASTPLEQAQDIMYQAWDAQGARRIRLARKALKVSKDCADAYVLLAEEATKTPNEARLWYEEAVAAGERALGKEFFEQNAGHFWSIFETRPYMRARTGLANCLYRLGQREEAAAHYQDMLRLNPNDNQGIRYILANLLLELHRYDELAALLGRYNEPTAALLYTRALATFEQQGPTKTATAQLRRAIGSNRFVPDYLTGKKPLPRHLPPFVGIGDEDEAVHYAFDAQTTWGKNPEALAWLREVSAAP